MDFRNLGKTWSGALTENKFLRIGVAGSGIAMVILAYAAVSKPTIVTMVPPNLKQQVWVSEGSAAQGYKTSWGLYMAMLLGNATPGNVDYLKQAIGPVLSPSIYKETMDALNKQSIHIKQDGVTMRFEQRTVQYEKSTNKVFVQGYSYVRGAGGDETRDTRTYEFKINVQDYAPVFTYFDTYSGRARTQEALAHEKRGNS